MPKLDLAQQKDADNFLQVLKSLDEEQRNQLIGAMRAAVEEIKKDGVLKNARSKIRKAALIIHPDKNDPNKQAAYGAAFKVYNEAFLFKLKAKAPIADKQSIKDKNEAAPIADRHIIETRNSNIAIIEAALDKLTPRAPIEKIQLPPQTPIVWDKVKKENVHKSLTKIKNQIKATRYSRVSSALHRAYSRHNKKIAPLQSAIDQLIVLANKDDPKKLRDGVIMLDNAINTLLNQNKQSPSESMNKLLAELRTQTKELRTVLGIQEKVVPVQRPKL